MIVRALIAALVVVAGGTARAGPEAAAEEAFASGIFADMTRACGRIKLAIDWPSFDGQLQGNTTHHSAVGFCSGVAEGVRKTCEMPGGRRAVRKRIKAIECRYDGGATRIRLDRSGPVRELAGKTLRAGFQWDTVNIMGDVEDWLKKTLKAPGSRYSLADTLDISQAEKAMKDASFVRARSACGRRIKPSVRWDSFLPAIDGNKDHFSAVVYCGSIFDGIATACEDPHLKKRIAKKLKSVRCQYDAKITKAQLGRTGPRLKLRKGVLTATFGWETTEIDGKTHEWLTTVR